MYCIYDTLIAMEGAMIFVISLLILMSNYNCIFNKNVHFYNLILRQVPPVGISMW